MNIRLTLHGSENVKRSEFHNLSSRRRGFDQASFSLSLSLTRLAKFAQAAAACRHISNQRQGHLADALTV